MTFKTPKEFIAWDGEGTAIQKPPLSLTLKEQTIYAWEDRPKGERIAEDYKPEAQPYVLLANSVGGQITNEEGLSTHDCFELILQTKQDHPNSIFVGFGFNYDVNQMIKDFNNQCLWHLHDWGRTRFGGYIVKWLPRKSLYIRHGRTHRSAIIYDVFGFFQMSFLEACKQYLGEDDQELELIRRGKQAREAFTWEELDDFIIPYNKTELSMLVRMMDIVREEFAGCGINPGQWHGPGAIAAKTLSFNQIKIPRDQPEEVLDASQFAYAGGRFEQFRLGRYSSTVYEYDIHSAYPAAAFQLPDLSNGHWEYVRCFEPDSFGVWSIDYDESDRILNAFRPQPLFHRSENGSISYPSTVQGWYWTPEARFVPDSIQGGWVFRPHSNFRPFAFVKELYDQRRMLKLSKNSLERAIKLILNSLYGKLAQTVGGVDGPPSWHCLEAAGYITSFTRAKIYEAMLMNPRAIIAAETDAVFSTQPLNLPLSDELGDWEELRFKEITYLQSGFYYAIKENDELVVKYRGMDKDRDTGQPLGLPYGEVLDYLRDRTTGTIDGLATLHSYTTRYVGLGLGLRSDAVWRSWEKRDHYIRLDGYRSSKRRHVRLECPECNRGRSLYDSMHPLQIGAEAGSGKSFARTLPWRSVGGLEEKPMNFEDWKEMNPEWKDFANDVWRFQ